VNDYQREIEERRFRSLTKNASLSIRQALGSHTDDITEISSNRQKRRANLTLTNASNEILGAGSRSGSGVTGGHKDYLRLMLVNKLMKKYPQDKRRMIEGEVSYFVQHEHVTKDAIKGLE